jgi:hypothetical protein
LRAVLRVRPAIPIAAPDRLIDPDTGGHVVRVRVPSGLAGQYLIDNLIYRRRDGMIVSEPAGAAPTAAATYRGIGNLKDILDRGNTTDVIILDAKDKPLDALDLGAHICGLLNADQSDSMIVIRNFSPAQSILAGLGFGRQSVLQQIERHLRDIQRKCLPLLTLPRPELRHENQERIVLLSIPNTLTKAALYDGQGYLWNGQTLAPLTNQQVFDNYLSRASSGQIHRSSEALVQLLRGQIGWSIQPPHSLDGRASNRQFDLCAYDVQHLAMRWPQQWFEERQTGFHCDLIAPLRHALMRVGQDNRAASGDPLLSGTFHVRLENFLASGIDFKADFQNSRFENLPVYKRTNLFVTLRIRTGVLFKRRQRMALLRFRQPDMMLDAERIADLQQACADAGFRIYDLDEIQPGPVNSAVFQGVRNQGYHDISLVAGLVWNPVQLRRERHYTQRIDSKLTDTGMLDVRMLLWGAGDEAGKEIARLQLELHQIISQRLAYLGSE